jgi:hypothetical protein
LPDFLLNLGSGRPFDQMSAVCLRKKLDDLMKKDAIVRIPSKKDARARLGWEIAKLYEKHGYPTAQDEAEGNGRVFDYVTDKQLLFLYPVPIKQEKLKRLSKALQTLNIDYSVVVLKGEK